MRLISLLFLALLLAVLDTTLVVGRSWPLSLSLALAGWLTIASPQEWVLLRLCVVGIVVDTVIPGSHRYHAVLFVVMGLLFLPFRNLVFHGQAFAWAAWAAALVIADAVAVRALGYGPLRPDILAMAVGTAATAMFMGWLIDGLPRALHPVGNERA